MSIFGKIWDKITGHKKPETPAAPQAPTPQAPPVLPTAAPVASQPVDVEQVLSQMAEMKGGGGNWRTSIVDLLKLLDLDSSLAARKDLALADPRHAHGLDQIIDGPRRDALDIGLLDHRRQGLLGHAPRLEEAWKVAALPQLRNAQLDSPGTGLPVPVAIPVALRPACGVLLAVGRARHGADLQCHQPFGGKPDHLAQKVRIRGLLDKVAKAHHVSGHRWKLRSRLVSATRPYRTSPVTTSTRTYTTLRDSISRKIHRRPMPLRVTPIGCSCDTVLPCPSLEERNMARYILDLQSPDPGITPSETLAAESDDEAIELARLRLLLTNDFAVVKVRRKDRVVGTFRRDSAALDFTPGP